MALHVLRSLEDQLLKGVTHHLTIRTRTPVALYVLNQKRAHLSEIEHRFGLSITVTADETVASGSHFAIERGEPVERREVLPTSIQPDSVAPELGPEDEEPVEMIAEAAELEDEIASDREAPREADGEDGGRKRRRRRRRRGGERPDAAPQAEAASEPADEADEDEDDRPAVVSGAGGELDENGQRKRRRGRRGGRRGRRGRGGEERPAANGNGQQPEPTGMANEAMPQANDDRPADHEDDHAENGVEAPADVWAAPAPQVDRADRYRLPRSRRPSGRPRTSGPRPTNHPPPSRSLLRRRRPTSPAKPRRSAAAGGSDGRPSSDADGPALNNPRARAMVRE